MIQTINTHTHTDIVTTFIKPLKHTDLIHLVSLFSSIHLSLSLFLILVLLFYCLFVLCHTTSLFLLVFIYYKTYINRIVLLTVTHTHTHTHTPKYSDKTRTENKQIIKTKTLNVNVIL